MPRFSFFGYSYIHLLKLHNLHSGRLPLLYIGETQNVFIGMTFLGKKDIEVHTDLVQMNY